VKAAGRGFFWTWVARSVRGSVGAGAVATAALGLAAALVFTLVTVSSGVGAALGRELRAYGANVLVLPRAAPLRFGLGALELGPVEEERRLREADLLAVPRAAPAVVAVAPALLARVDLTGEAVGAVGYPIDALRAMNPSWRVRPAWPSAREAMAGAALAAHLRLAPGQEVELAASGRVARLRLAAIVETGGAEDENLIVPLDVLQALAGAPGEVSLALVRADLSGGDAAGVIRAVAAAVPGAEARSLAQVARAEGALLEKVRRLLLLVTVALAAAAAFTVSGTLGVLLLARRAEIGLYRALGAGAGSVRGLLLAEAAASGVAAGLGGSALGVVAAEAIAWSVFGAAVPIPLAAAPLALATALGLALLAAVWPVERALRSSPVDALRAP
jgi:putative ABC transport system permease protein